MERMNPVLERDRTELQPRDLGSLLNETFAIYGKHLWRFIGLVAVVQAPFSVASLAVVLALDGVGAFVAAAVLSIASFAVIYSAGTYAVGQQYVTGEIEIRRCYARSWWRALSLSLVTILAVAALLTLSFLAGLLVTRVFGSVADSTLTLGAYFAIFVVAVVGVYAFWATTFNSVIVEGSQSVRALRRAVTLMSGSWSRIAGITAITGLVALGLAILITVPFALANLAPGGDPASGSVTPIQVLGNLAVEIIVPPVLFITSALLYYDMRVRNEDFDFATLSRELGVAAA